MIGLQRNPSQYEKLSNISIPFSTGVIELNGTPFYEF